MAPPTEFTTSFMRAACGALSSSMTRAERARRAGRAFSRAWAGPPATMVSCAFSAADLDPSSGAETKEAPRAPTRSSTDLALRTPAVDTSTSTAPLPRPASAPSGPSRAASTAFSSETHRKTRSWPAAASRGVAALFAPFFTSGSALDAVRFQTVTVWPDLRRLLAMGAPMVPVPRKPIFMVRPL